MTMSPEGSADHSWSDGMARWAFLQLRLLHPTMVADLHRAHCQYFIHIKDSQESFETLAADLEDVRPITTQLRLVRAVPTDTVLLDKPWTLSEDIWQKNQPITHLEMTRLLGLIEPNLPDGEIAFSPGPITWIFSHPDELSVEQMASVLRACRDIGLNENVGFVQHTRPMLDAAKKTTTIPGDDLDVITLRERRPPTALGQRLVERDEDEWRWFLNHRAEVTNTDLEAPSSGFSALFDANDNSDVRLAELLCIYDVVNVIPECGAPRWLERHNLTLESLRELTERGRIRLVLPRSVEQYAPSVIDAVAGVDLDAVTMTRSLAMRTILNGQAKDPLLYGPFTVEQRIDLIGAIFDKVDSQPIRNSLRTYCSRIAVQNRMFIGRGANGSYGAGFGMSLGELLHALTQQDRRLELAVAGASVEWAMALHANLIPVQLGTMDSSAHASIVANWVNRTRHAPAQPLSPKLHSLVDGLLTLTDFTPLEVAKQVSSSTIANFRQLARNMIHGTASVGELQIAVEKLNDDVRSFESRRSRLQRYRIGSTLGAVVLLPVGNNDHTGGLATVAVGALARTLLTIFAGTAAAELVNKASSQMIEAMTALATNASQDAVVVSRMRSELIAPNVENGH